MIGSMDTLGDITATLDAPFVPLEMAVDERLRQMEFTGFPEQVLMSMPEESPLFLATWARFSLKRDEFNHRWLAGDWF